MHVGVFTATSPPPRRASAPTYGLRERKQMISAGLDDFNKIYCRRVRILAVALGEDVSSCEMSAQNRTCTCESLTRTRAAVGNALVSVAYAVRLCPNSKVR